MGECAMAMTDALEDLKTWILQNVDGEIPLGKVRARINLIDDAVRKIRNDGEPAYPEKNRNGSTVCGNCRIPFGNGFAYDKWNYCPRCGKKILWGDGADTQEEK